MGAVSAEPTSPPPRSDRDDADPGATVLLRAEGLGRRVGDGPDRRWVWREVDLRLRPGELVTVRGATGAGKSLLLRSLAQLDPVQEGTMELLGRSAASWSPTEWRRRVAYLHQTPVLLPGTVEENLRAPFDWKAHREGGYDREALLERLEPLERGRSWLERRAEDLSGGERQIAALLRALLVRPAVLLLDEPTAALDPEATTAVERLVRSWLEGGSRGRRAVLWVTHDEDQARRMGGRRLVLEGGRVRPESEPEGPDGAGAGSGGSRRTGRRAPGPPRSGGSG